MKMLYRVVLKGDPHDPRQARWELFSALSVWSCLAMLITAVVIARAAGASLFLSHYGGRALAVVYVTVGLAVVAIIYGLSWITHGIRYDRVAIGTILILGGGTAGFRLMIPSFTAGGSDWAYCALYIFLETFALVTTMQVWTLANSLFSSAQARRLYVFIATGGIIGSLLGGLTTRSCGSLPTLDLLWLVVGLCPPMILAIRVFANQAMQLSRLVVKRPAFAVSASGDWSNAGDAIVEWIRHPVLRQRPVLRLVTRLSLLAFLSAFTTNLIDFYFKTYADEQFHGDTAGLTRFFGNFYLSVGFVSLLMQLVVTSAIVQRSRIFIGLALTPAILAAGTIWNLFAVSLTRATVLKLIDSGFAHSVHRSCVELLYTPLPANLTGEIKLVSEGVAGRAGLVMSGLTLWFLAPSLNPARTLALVACLLCGWFVALLILKRTYRTAVTDTQDPIARPTWDRAA
jgi:AAA family ATP:ADP antiporter